MAQIHELGSASSIASGQYLAVDTGSATLKIDYNLLAKAILEQYTGSTIAGSAQSVQTALDTINEEMWYEFSTDSDITVQVDALNTKTHYVGYVSSYGSYETVGVPINTAFYVDVMVHTSDYAAIIITSMSNNGRRYIKKKANGTWSSWYEYTGTAVE